MMLACLAVALPQAAHPLATVNAVLNGLATILLVAGWLAIRRGRVKAHRTAMTAAFVTSCVFLVSYLARYAIEGTHRFAGPDAVRPLYLAILCTHVPLAAAVPVLALRMFFLALRGRFDAHRRLGRITLPIWLYVSVTGVVIYLMLYVLFPAPRKAAVSAWRPGSQALADRDGPPAIMQA